MERVERFPSIPNGSAYRAYLRGYGRRNSAEFCGILRSLRTICGGGGHKEEGLLLLYYSFTFGMHCRFIDFYDLLYDFFFSLHFSLFPLLPLLPKGVLECVFCILLYSEYHQ